MIVCKISYVKKKTFSREKELKMSGLVRKMHSASYVFNCFSKIYGDPILIILGFLEDTINKKV